MVKIESDNGKIKLDIKGNTSDIARDTLVALRAIYNMMQKDKKEAMVYKAIMDQVLGDPDMTPFKVEPLIVFKKIM